MAVFHTHPGMKMMVYVAPNDPDRQLRGSSAGMRRSTPAASDEREPNSRQVAFPPDASFTSFLTQAGKAMGLSAAPRRAFVPLEGLGGHVEAFSVRDLNHGDLVYISSGEPFREAHRDKLTAFAASRDEQQRSTSRGNGQGNGQGSGGDGVGRGSFASAASGHSSAFAPLSPAARGSFAGSTMDDSLHTASTHGTPASGPGSRDGRTRVAVLGAGGVGKSCLTHRLLKGPNWRFNDSHDPTIEDAYKKDLFVDEARERIEVVDTAGQEEFSSFRHTWMQDKDAYVLVFSLTDARSLDALTPYAQLHFLIHGADGAKGSGGAPRLVPPLVLVGNKQDLVEHSPKLRQVTGDQARARLAQWKALFDGCECVGRVGAMEYLEVSAKTGKGAAEAFHSAVRHVRAQRVAEAHRDKRLKKKQAGGAGILASLFGCSAGC